MKKAKPEQGWTTRYWNAFRYHAHQLIAWGYEDAYPELVQCWEETDITGCISEAIDARLEAPRRPPWCDHYDIREESPVPSKTLRGKRRKRTDITIVCTKGKRAKFIFEAKPLRPHSSYREALYVGPDGLQRFLRGEYAERYQEAGMLGYVQCESIEGWKTRIVRVIQDDAVSQNMLGLLKPQCDVSVIPEFSNEWTSSHVRVSGKPITIFHILLDVRPK